MYEVDCHLGRFTWSDAGHKQLKPQRLERRRIGRCRALERRQCFVRFSECPGGKRRSGLFQFRRLDFSSWRYHFSIPEGRRSNHACPKLLARTILVATLTEFELVME